MHSHAFIWGFIHWSRVLILHYLPMLKLLLLHILYEEDFFALRISCSELALSDETIL